LSDSEEESDCTTPVLKTQFISKMMSVHEEEDEEEPEKLGVTKDEIMREIAASEEGDSECVAEGAKKVVEIEND
jgi:hypothetical protein